MTTALLTLWTARTRNCARTFPRGGGTALAMGDEHPSSTSENDHEPAHDAHGRDLETIDAGSLNNVCGGGKKEDPGQKGVLGLDRKKGKAVGKAVGSLVGSVGGPVGRAAFGAAGAYIGSSDHGRDLGRDYQRNIANGADPYTG